MEPLSSPVAANRDCLDFNDAPLQSLTSEAHEQQPTVEEVRQRIHDNLSQALYHMFPAGRIKGKKLFIGDVQGHKGDSLSVELSGNKVGQWWDFATGQGGDIFALWAARYGWNTKSDFPKVIDSIRDWLGIPQRSFATKPANKQNESSSVLVGKWEYLDTDGKLLAISCRYDTPDGKSFRLWDAKSQRYKAPEPRPLYNLPGIVRSDTVVLVEGEKCAEALIKLGICATTIMGGANAPLDKNDWSPLKGKHVTIWPDHDEPGKAYGRKVAQKLKDVGVASLALLAIPEDKPAKWDGADAVEEGMDVPTFMQACAKENIASSQTDVIANSTVQDPKGRNRQGLPTIEPIPLRKPLERAKKYPVEALGELLGGATLDICDKIQVPLAICAQSVLVNAALVIQAHIDIQLPFGQISPVSLYLISLSESGGRKSTSDSEASAFIKKREAELRVKHDKELTSYKNAKDTYDAARRKILTDKTKSQQDSEIALNALGDSPKPPMDHLLTVPEPTYEGICNYFINGFPSIGLFSDEGAQFIGGHGMNADNKLKTVAGLSSLWSGGTIKRMRRGDGAIVLPGKRLSIHLMIQPYIAVNMLLCDQELLQQGFLARLLVVYPQHMFGTRLSTNNKTRDGRVLKEFNDRMLQIAQQELPLNPESDRNELIPRVLTMTPEAEAAFYKFADSIELRLKDGGDLEHIRGFGSKLAEQASRMAAVLAYAEDPNLLHLEKQYFDRGAILAEYYAQEALRLLGNEAPPPAILEAESLLQWLEDVWPSKTITPNLISLPEICRIGPNKIRLKESAMKALQTLEDHGWLIKEPKGAVIDGNYRKEVWRIRREFLAKSPTSQPESQVESSTILPTSVPLVQTTDTKNWEGINI